MEIEHLVVIAPAVMAAVGLLIWLASKLVSHVTNDAIWMGVMRDFFVSSSYLGSTIAVMFGIQHRSAGAFATSVLWGWVMLINAVACGRRQKRLSHQDISIANLGD